MIRREDLSHDDCQYALERCDRLESCHDDYANLTRLGCSNWEVSTEGASEEVCKGYYGEEKHNQCKAIYNKLFWEPELMRAYLGECHCMSPKEDSSMTDERTRTCNKRWNKIFGNPCFTPEVHHLEAEDDGTNPYNPVKHRQCVEGFSQCIANVEHLPDCGLPLMNISIYCRPDEDGQCSHNHGLCIDSLANFFFNDVDPFWTRIMFNCCEHKNDCYGLPEHVFSPWKCLGKDPFYSCMSVKEECDSIPNCQEHYNAIFNPTICPAEVHQKILDNQLECPETLPEICAMSLDAVSLWYCSCENMEGYLRELGNENPTHAEVAAAYNDCMIQKGIFTHNECHQIHIMNVDPEYYNPSPVPTKDPSKDESHPPITTVLLILIALVLLAALLLRLRFAERLYSLSRWSDPREIYRNWRSSENRPLAGSLFSSSRPNSGDERNANGFVANPSRSKILPVNCVNTETLQTDLN